MTGSSAAVVDLGTMHARPVVFLVGDAIPYRERRLASVRLAGHLLIIDMWGQ